MKKNRVIIIVIFVFLIIIFSVILLFKKSSNKTGNEFVGEYENEIEIEETTIDDNITTNDIAMPEVLQPNVERYKKEVKKALAD